MSYLFKVAFYGATIILALSTSAKQIDFFRRDYIYNESFDAFYKLHRGQWISWDDAFLACDDEGAMLFYPKNETELHMVKNFAVKVAKEHRDNITDIFLGIHNKYGSEQFVSVDGEKDFSKAVTQPVPVAANFPDPHCVLTNIYELKGSLRVVHCTSLDLPQQPYFFCKQENRVMCPTIDQDYKYIKSLRKCYKINQRRKTWQDAYKTCYMEGGHLVVIQDENEARLLQKYLRYQEDSYHIGIRRITTGGEMYTVKGQKVGTLHHDEVRRENDDNRGDCGAISVYAESSSEVKTVSTNCQVKLPFICELE